MFIDESGILSEPLVKRTWGLCGRTPTLLHRCRHRRKLSVIGALTISPARRRLGLLLRWHADRSIRTPQVLSFLRALLKSVRGHLIVVWDGLLAHRASAVRELAGASGRMDLERLPGYAPDLNPMEGGWGHIKWHQMANHGLAEVPKIHAMAKRAGRKVSSSQRLLRSFVKASQLPLRL